MREIKFRAWDMGKKRMVYFDEFERFGFINHKMDDTISLTGSVSLLLSTDPEYYIWLQFTGLKDKNGKEIYEGDIVGISGSSKEPFIIWSEMKFNCGCCSHVYGWEFVGSRFDFDEKEFEVFGNIYENPELKP